MRHIGCATHVASDNTGPYTAYTQQYVAMREAVILNPNPRKQLLQDLSELTETNKSEGFRPVLMMDANETITATKTILSWRILYKPRGL